MITYNVDGDGIATLTWDMPNRSMNVLNAASMEAYAGALEQALKDDKHLRRGLTTFERKLCLLETAEKQNIPFTDPNELVKTF